MSQQFELVSDFKMTGDQPQAVDKLVAGLQQDYKKQTLLGVTGSGKTFTMANVVMRVQRPTLVLSGAHDGRYTHLARRMVDALPLGWRATFTGAGFIPLASNALRPCGVLDAPMNPCWLADLLGMCLPFRLAFDSRERLLRCR